MKKFTNCDGDNNDYRFRIFLFINKLIFMLTLDPPERCTLIKKFGVRGICSIV